MMPAINSILAVDSTDSGREWQRVKGSKRPGGHMPARGFSPLSKHGMEAATNKCL